MSQFFSLYFEKKKIILMRSHRAENLLQSSSSGNVKLQNFKFPNDRLQIVWHGNCDPDVGAGSKVYWIDLKIYGGVMVFGDIDNPKCIKKILEYWAGVAGAHKSQWVIHPNHVEALVAIRRGVSLGYFVAVLKLRSVAEIAAKTGYSGKHLWAPGYEGRLRISIPSTTQHRDQVGLAAPGIR